MGEMGWGGSEMEKGPERLRALLENLRLLRLLLLLLADADLEVQYLGFLERLVIVTRHGICKVLIHVGFPGENRHQREILVASRAKGPEPFYIRNRHNPYILAHWPRHFS